MTVYKSALTLFVIIGIGFSSAITSADVDKNRDNRVALEDADPELAGAWWQWALAIPAGQNPILDPDGSACHLGQQDDVWYLAGTFGGPVTRSCTIPEDTSLVIPIFNGIWLTEPNEAPAPHDELLEQLSSQVEPCFMRLRIDGKPVVGNLDSLLLHTEESFTITLPEANVLGVPAGTYGPAAALGAYAVVKPLAPGEHTVEFVGTDCKAEDDFQISATYNLVVEADDPP